MNNVKQKRQKWYRAASLSLNELVTGRRILGGDYLSQKWKQPIGEHTKWKKSFIFHIAKCVTVKTKLFPFTNYAFSSYITFRFIGWQ